MLKMLGAAKHSLRGGQPRSPWTKKVIKAVCKRICVMEELEEGS